MESSKNKQIATTANLAKPARKEGQLKNASTFDEFILWYALPRNEKLKMGLEWQEQFADFHKISEWTLTQWKKRQDFLPRVQDLRKQWTQARTSDVIAAIYQTAMKGNPLSQKLWMQVFEGWSEKTEVQVTNKVELSVNDIRFMIEALPQELKEKHYANFTELLNDVTQFANARNIDPEIINEHGEFQDGVGSDESEGEVRDQADIDAQVVSIIGGNELAESDTAGLRFNLANYLNRPASISASDYQSSTRRWQEQAPRNCWI